MTEDATSLPTGWRWASLDEFAMRTPSAFVDGPFGSELKVSDLVRKGIPLIRIQHIGVGSFRPGFDQFISEKKFIELKKHDVLPGDLVFAKLGDPAGRSTLIPSDISRGLIVADCVRLRIDSDKVEPRFLGWAVNAPAVLQQISGSSKGSTRQRANLSDFKKLRVPVPKSRDEQKRIARLLEQADRLRRIRHYALELSDTFLSAAFLGLFGDLSTNVKGWESYAFDEVCTIDAPLVDPKKPEYRNLPHIGGDNIESVTGRIVRLKTAAEDGLISSKFLIEPAHILFSKIRPKLRKVSEPRMVALCSADIYPIQPRSNALKASYLAGFLRSDYFSRIVSNIAESRTNIPKINRDELSDIPVLLPPITEQEKFAELAKRHERMLASQREALRQADHLFQSLLQRTFAQP